MALPDLTGLNIEDTYQRVLQTDGTVIYDGTGSLVFLQVSGSFSGSYVGDGSGLTGVTATSAPAGPDQSIQFNDAGTTSGSGNFTFDKINNIVNLTGSLIATSFTGSLQGTASWAYSASQAISASYALSSSHALSSSYALSSSFAASSSYALSASQAVSASFASNGGVTQLLAGPNITLSPTTGVGQVTISSTGGGSSFNTATGSYGSFYSTQTQTNVAGTARSMSLNTTNISNGVSISGSTNPYNTYIKVENAGVYDIQFSAQVDKTDSGTDEIWIWIRKNGSNISDSATSVQLVGNGAHYVAAWNFFVNAAAGDYFQLMWYSPDANVRLHAEAAFGVVPGIPSLIVTANRVDQFLSNTGSFSGSFIGSHTGSFTGSFTGSLLGTSSWASNAVFANGATYANQVFIAENTSPGTYSIPVYPDGGYDGNNTLLSANILYDFSTQALTVNNITASNGLFGTASWATNALTASYIPNYITTASVSSNTITFTKGDGSTFPITVNTGSGGGGTDLGLTYAISIGYFMP